MSREDDILTAIDRLDGFTFQKFARRLLQRERYPDLNPLPDQNDLGQDARTEELPVTELPDLQQTSCRLTFAISKTNTKQKVTDDCDSCQENDLDIDAFVFITSGEVTNRKRTNWEDTVKTDYGWDLIVHDRTWFADHATKPAHEKLVDEVLNVPPLNGDYFGDIVTAFSQVTESTLSPINTTLPYIDRHIDQDITEDIISRLTDDQSVVLSGNAGVGKTGVLGQIVNQWDTSSVLFVDARQFSEVSNRTELQQEFDFEGQLSDAIERVGHHGGCLLVVDQLDNIGGTPAAGLFKDLLTDVVASDGVNILAACRKWDLCNRNVYEPLRERDSFETVELTAVTASTVEEVLNQLGITDYSDELINLGKNLLNLSIIAELRSQTSIDQINYSEMKNQVELWDHYQETLVERETQGTEWDRESGYNVRARAIELAQHGLAEGSRVFPISLRRERADERLISRNVLHHERGERYRFRHDELQDYFYAWNAVNRQGWTTPRPVLEEVDERVAAGVFRWMLRMLIEEETELAREFLGGALAPDGLGYYAATTIIDEVVEWDPQAQPTDLLKTVVTTIEAREDLRNYFYSNLSNPAWLSFFHDQDLYDNPDGPLLAYLKRAAADEPTLATEIIDETNTEDENTRAFFLRIAGSLPADYATANTSTFQGWLPDATVHTGPYTVHYTELIETLLEKEKPGAALALLKTLLQPQDPDPDFIEHETEDGGTVTWKVNTEATALARGYTMEDAVQNTWENLPNAYRKKLLQVLEEQLRTAVDLEADVKEVRPTDIRWPIAITDSKHNNIRIHEILLQSLRDFREEWVSEDPTDDSRQQRVTEYLGDILLFRRLGLHLLQTHADAYPDLVREELLDRSNYYSSPKIQPEFFKLLRDGFTTLEKSDRKEVLRIIDDGPDKDELQEIAEAREDQFSDRTVKQVVEQECELQQLRRFWMIREHLPEPYSTKVDDFVDQYGEPDHPESPMSSEGGMVSHVGPMKIEKLRRRSPKEILNLCVTWDPETDDQSDFLTEVSPRGLAQDLQTLVSESPNAFVPYLPALTEADSIYISFVFGGLENAIEEENCFDWEPVLELCLDAITRFDERRAGDTRRGTCRLLRNGLSKPDCGLVEHHSTEVRNILLELSDDPEQSLEEQSDQDFIAHDDPTHVSINAVRPIAVNTLISYALENAKSEGFDGSNTENESGFENPVKDKLHTRMVDPSTAVHSIFGQRLLHLDWLDHSFVQENLDTIFPCDGSTESRERFTAAWMAYIRGSPWQPDVYDWLKECYFHSIDLQIEENHSNTYNYGERLAGHALCSFIHTDEPLGDGDSLLTYFYEQVSPEIAGNGSWQLWSWGNQNTEFRDQWSMVRELWEWRLNMVEDDYETHSREFEWFVEWLDLVGDTVEADEIDILLNNTIPYIAQQRRSWETLETYLVNTAPDSPLTSIQIYRNLIDQPEWPGWVEFGETTWQLLETVLETGGHPKEIALDTTEEIAMHDSDYLKLLEEYRIG